MDFMANWIYYGFLFTLRVLSELVDIGVLIFRELRYVFTGEDMDLDPLPQLYLHQHSEKTLKILSFMEGTALCMNGDQRSDVLRIIRAYVGGTYLSYDDRKSFERVVGHPTPIIAAVRWIEERFGVSHNAFVTHMCRVGFLPEIHSTATKFDQRLFAI